MTMYWPQYDQSEVPWSVLVFGSHVSAPRFDSVVCGTSMQPLPDASVTTIEYANATNFERILCSCGADNDSVSVCVVSAHSYPPFMRPPARQRPRQKPAGSRGGPGRRPD